MRCQAALRSSLRNAPRSSLLARANSEFYLATHELPLAPTTRQVQNELLRKLRLWERLDEHELALVTRADGLWNEAQRAEAIAWCEQLRLVRWVFRIDAEIVPLAHNPGVDFSLSAPCWKLHCRTVVHVPARIVIVDAPISISCGVARRMRRPWARPAPQSWHASRRALPDIAD